MYQYVLIVLSTEGKLDSEEYTRAFPPLTTQQPSLGPWGHSDVALGLLAEGIETPGQHHEAGTVRLFWVGFLPR